MTDYIHLYYSKIESGEIVACQKITKVFKKLAYEIDHPGKYYFDDKKAKKPIEFVERFCKNSKGKWMGKSIKMTLMQKAMVSAIFGFIDSETGIRRFNEVFAVMGRKNGKSVLISAIALYMMMADGEGGPEIACVATKKDQARIVFDESANMVKQSPYLRKYIHKRKSDLYSGFNFGTFHPLSSDSNTLDGLNLHCGIIDEIHAVADRNIYDVTKQSMSARTQPLLVIISTAGFLRQTVYDSLYDYAEGVINGTIEDDHFLPLIYELDKKEEWQDEKCWEKANPNIKEIKSVTKLKEYVERAKNDRSYLPTVLTKDFNIRETTSSSWLSFDEVDNPETFDIEDLRDTYAIGGCDLSATTDLSCATLLVRKPGVDKVFVLQQYFLPEERLNNLDKTISKEAPYRIWADRGLLTVCDGNMVRYSDVTAWFKRMQDEYDITLWRLGYDRALAGYWVDEMIGQFGRTVMEKVAQGPFTWTQPMKEMGAALGEKKINYNNNPMLKWCLLNTGVKSSGTIEAIQPIKISANKRIDGMVSLLNAYVIYTKYREDYLNMIGE